MKAPSQYPMPWVLIENVALGLILFGLLLFRRELETASLVNASRITTAIVVFAVFTVVRVGPRSMWSPSAVFVIIMALFHGGLVAAYGLGREPPAEDFEATQRWLYRSSTVIALWLTDLACVGYALGVRLARARRAPPQTEAAVNANLDQVVGVTGVVITVASLLGWFFIALTSGGPGMLVSSYDNFLTTTQGSLLPVTDRFLDYGMVFLAASTWTRGHTATIALYVVWSLIAFPLGMRGEVLFPAFAMLAVLAVRRIPMRASRAALVALALLTAIAMIRDLRQVGVKDVGTAELSLNPLDGLIEMGSSLRPVSEVVFWHQMGDEFDDGATYWAPVDRQLYYVVPGWTRPAAADDDRLMSTLVMERAGPIGFSIIAEAYRNFAAAGVFLVLMLVGYVLGRVDVWPRSLAYQCAGGVVLTGLLAHVRNPFVPVPTHFVTGFLMIGALLLIARARAERGRRRPP